VIKIFFKDGELPKFIPHQPGSFGLTLSVNLGIINKLTVGHERRGYG
jgi:hypothetical protein